MYAQVGNLFITNYPPSTYYSDHFVVSPQNWRMMMDDSGIVYIGNTSLILEFDGVRWGMVDSSEGFGWSRFAKAEDGNVYVSGVDKLGMIVHDQRGKTYYKSLLPFLPPGQSHFEASKIFCDKSEVYFCCSAQSLIYKWDGSSFTRVNLPEGCSAIPLRNQLFIFVHDSGCYKMDNDSRQLILDGSLFKSLHPWFAVPLTKDSPDLDNSFLICREGIFTFLNRSLKKMTGAVFDEIVDATPSDGKLLSNGLIAISTKNSGIYLFNKTGNLVRLINPHTSSIMDDEVNGLYDDNDGGLWVTMETGVSRIQYDSPLSFLDLSNNLKGNRINKILKKDSVIYTGTSSGLYVLDLNMADHLFLPKLSTKNVWDFIFNDDDLLTASDFGLIKIRNQVRDTLYTGHCYCLMPLGHNPDLMLVGLSNGIGAIKKKNGQWYWLGELDSCDITVRSMAETPEGIVWAGTDDICTVDFSKGFSLNARVTRLDEQHGYFIDPNNEFEFYKTDEGIFCCSLHGLYKVDENGNQLLPYDELGKHFTGGGHEAYELTKDDEGNLWLFSEYKMWKLSRKNGTLIYDSTSFRGMPNQTAVRTVFADGNQIWVGSDLGIYIFDKGYSRHSAKNFHTSIRKAIITGDSVIYYGPDSSLSRHRYVIQFADNDIVFEFSSNDYENASRNLYSFMLEGKDSLWSDWSAESKRTLNNLHEGKYTFHVKSKNLYGAISAPATLSFLVLPPWYRTWWAYLLYAVLAVLLILLILWLNQRRLILAKRNLEHTVRTRTGELEEKTRMLENTMQELKNTESQLIHSEKMASLGQLTAGIAHEINNPINFVAGNVAPLQRDIHELLEMIYKYNQVIEEKNLGFQFAEIDHPNNKEQFEITIDEVNKLLKGIQEGSNRTAEIVRGLRNFSRIDEAEIVKVNINDSIDSTLTLLYNKYKNRIDVVKDYDPMLPEIEGYPGPLNQVFMNLLSNAVDAIEDEGKIFIITTNIGDQVKIVIHDTGTGIKKEAMNKIFDPFFTTKPVGEGTGLGLAISYGIIEKHNGKITAKSEAGKGAAFTIILPVKQPE